VLPHLFEIPQLNGNARVEYSGIAKGTAEKVLQKLTGEVICNNCPFRDQCQPLAVSFQSDFSLTPKPGPLAIRVNNNIY
jgi:hypothetical protein